MDTISNQVRKGMKFTVELVELNPKSTAIMINGQWFDTVNPADVLRRIREAHQELSGGSHGNE